MNGMGRDNAPFSGRVWQEIDQAVALPRGANCTARRFLPTDGPYGVGLTSVAGDDHWLDPNHLGPDSKAWGVTRATKIEDGDDYIPVPSSGTFLVSGTSRPVPMILSEFALGLRTIEAYESGGQPLDTCRATKAARDVALEEERLIYYGTTATPEYSGQDQALLKVKNNTSQIKPDQLFDSLHDGFWPWHDGAMPAPSR